MRKMGKWKEITHLGQQDKMTTLHGERVTRAAGVRGMVRAVGVKAVQCSLWPENACLGIAASCWIFCLNQALNTFPLLLLFPIVVTHL